MENIDINEIKNMISANEDNAKKLCQNLAAKRLNSSSMWWHKGFQNEPAHWSRG